MYRILLENQIFSTIFGKSKLFQLLFFTKVASKIKNIQLTLKLEKIDKKLDYKYEIRIAQKKLSHHM